MNKICKILLIGLFTLFVGYNMLSAESKSYWFNDNIFIWYDDVEYTLSEDEVEEAYFDTITEWKWVEPKTMIFPSNINATLDIIEHQYGKEMKNMFNKTFTFAKKYGAAMLYNKETKISLCVAHSKYGEISDTYYFWYCGNN